jgi:hypothetical protein
VSGYTPVFAQIYQGTLYGKWPAAAVWASLLPLLDKNGHLEMSLQAISGMTGWPMDLLKQGIDELMQPDPSSRSAIAEGRRLVMIDAQRDWGWIAVNHSIYREKARLMAKSKYETSAGLNSKRMNDRRRPPETAGDRQEAPLTASHTHTHIPVGADESTGSDSNSMPEDSINRAIYADARRILGLSAGGMITPHLGAKGKGIAWVVETLGEIDRRKMDPEAARAFWSKMATPKRRGVVC